MASGKPQQQQGGHIVPNLTVQTRRVKLTPSQPDEDYLRAQSLNRIRLMVESDLGATRLGQMLYELASDLSNEAKITSTLSDAFAAIYKRTASLWAYFRDAPGCYHSRLHLSEAKAYEYVSKLRGSAGRNIS